mmetsp:Transcript_8625/g.11982  ORF Transcript_8625/g.11982 Transcript_8625/m.11982 type:complete len:656 (+) Transcript_8625:56-2023(+)
METKSENEKPERWWEETTFDYAQNNNDEEYLTTGSEWLGRKIYLQEHEVWATVIKWLPAEKNDGIAFWRVRHADGDDEDLELHELEAAWSCAKIEERNENHTSSSMDDDDDDDNENIEKSVEERVYKIDETIVAPRWEDVNDLIDESKKKMIYLAWRGIEAAANEDECNSFGECVEYFTNIGKSAPEPLRGLALYHAERLAQRCKARIKRNGLPEEPGELSDALIDVYALESAGVSHSELKIHCQQIAKKIRDTRGKNAVASSFLGYDPLGLGGSKYAKIDANRSLHERIQEDLKSIRQRLKLYPNDLRPITYAMLTAFYTDRLGLDLLDHGTAGMTLESVLRSSLPIARKAYLIEDLQQPPNFDLWLDILACVATVIDVASNFGEFSLRKWLVPDEYAFIVRPDNIQFAIHNKDIHAVAELVRLARIFLTDIHDPLAQAVLDIGIPFLIQNASYQEQEPNQDKEQHLVQEQQNTNPWQPRAESSLPYARFKANIDAARALYQPIRRGFGPALPHIKELYKSLAASSPAFGDALFSSSSDNNNNEDHIKPYISEIDQYAQCAVRLFTDNAITNLKASAYDGAARAPDESSDSETEDLHLANGFSGLHSIISLRDRAAGRLAGLLKWKALTDGRLPRFGFDASLAPAAKRRRRMLR